MAGSCKGGNEPPGSLKAGFRGERLRYLLDGYCRSTCTMMEFCEELMNNLTVVRPARCAAINASKQLLIETGRYSGKENKLVVKAIFPFSEMEDVRDIRKRTVITLLRKLPRKSEKSLPSDVVHLLKEQPFEIFLDFSSRTDNNATSNEDNEGESSDVK
ncbi:hypothetical protein ANN_21009 [Periplaneta americana]|uniref:Uncharacterized protein n=1 Tax=Periplaneta americana TaxID=6978 RepID=A0ABQ8SFB1_PERAM|nr:hypothetical protein ANN_21009 [Periplaneta americana]